MDGLIKHIGYITIRNKMLKEKEQGVQEYGHQLSQHSRKRIG